MFLIWYGLAESLAYPNWDEASDSTCLPSRRGGGGVSTLWYLPYAGGGPDDAYQREVEAGEGTGVAGEGGHHLAAGGGPDDDEAVLCGAGRHQPLARRHAGPAARPVPGQSAHLHSWDTRTK